MWSFDEAVAKVVAKLTPLYELRREEPGTGRSSSTSTWRSTATST